MQDVAFDVRHDGHADGAIGIELQLAQYRPPCDLDHHVRPRCAVRWPESSWIDPAIAADD